MKLVIQSHGPAPALRRCVRYYYQVEDLFESALALQPVPARSPEIIEFMFATHYRIERLDAQVVEECWPATLVGTRTHRGVNLFLSGRIDAFTIAFRPGGISALFGIPSQELTNCDFDAYTMPGGGISELRQRLGEATGFAKRVQVADAFLTDRRQDFDRPSAAIKAARMIHLCRGAARIDDLVDRTGLGIRQFERRFVREVGMPPKLYARIVRFEAALRMKAARPETRWIEVAHALGYFDQMHMVHDFKRLSGETPSVIVDQLDMFVQPEVAARQPA